MMERETYSEEEEEEGANDEEASDTWLTPRLISTHFHGQTEKHTARDRAK